MKRVLSIVCVALALLSAGGALLFRDGLARMPGDRSFAFDFPSEAYMTPDGGFVVLDRQGTRVSRLAADGAVAWSAVSGPQFGRFLSLDVADDGVAYVIDSIEAQVRPAGYPGWQQEATRSDAAAGTSGAAGADALPDTSPVEVRFERILRIGADGQPAGVIAQKRADAGFVRGSLRIQGGYAWFLYEDADGKAVLARSSLADGGESLVARTDWAFAEAALAPGGPDGQVTMAAGGGLVRFRDGTVEPLAELADELPYPTDLRYGADGSLYVADPVAGVLGMVDRSGSYRTMVNADALSRGGQGRRGVIMDSFSLSKDGFVFVDQDTASIVVLDRNGVPVRDIAAARVSDAEANRSLAAWILLACACLFGAITLATGLVVLAARGPEVLAAAAGLVPGVVAALVLAAWWTGMDGARTAEEADAADLRSLRAAATAAAGAIDPGLPGLVRLPADHGSGPWNRLRAVLSRAVSPGSVSGDGSGRYPLAMLYTLRDGSFRFVCDAEGRYRPGLPQRFMPEDYYVAMQGGKPASATIRDADGSWLSAAAPVLDLAGRPVALVEFSSPAHEPVRALPAPERVGLAAASVLVALAGAGLVRLMRKRRWARRITDATAAVRLAAGIAAPPGPGKRGIWSLSGAMAELEKTVAVLVSGPFAEAANPEPAEAPPEPDPEPVRVAEPPATVKLAVGAAIKKAPSAGPAATSAQNAAAPVSAHKPATVSPEERELASMADDMDRACRKEQHREAIRALQSGDAAGAAAILERLLGGRRDDPRVLNNLGVAYRRLGRLPEAVACLERSLELEPGNADTRANLEKLRQALGTRPAGRP